MGMQQTAIKTNRLPRQTVNLGDLFGQCNVPGVTQVVRLFQFRGIVNPFLIFIALKLSFVIPVDTSVQDAFFSYFPHFTSKEGGCYGEDSKNGLAYVGERSDQGVLKLAFIFAKIPLCLLLARMPGSR